MRSSNLSHMPNRTGHVDRCGDGGGGDGNEHRRQKKDEPMDHVSGFPGFVLFEARYTIWNRIATRAMSLTLLLRRKRSGSVLCIESRNRTVSCSEAVCHSHKGHDIRGISWPVECLRRGLFPIMLEQTEAAHDRPRGHGTEGTVTGVPPERTLCPEGRGATPPEGVAGGTGRTQYATPRLRRLSFQCDQAALMVRHANSICVSP